LRFFVTDEVRAYLEIRDRVLVTRRVNIMFTGMTTITLKQLMLVCVWPVVGITLTAAAMWLGLEVFGGLP